MGRLLKMQAAARPGGLGTGQQDVRSANTWLRAQESGAVLLLMHTFESYSPGWGSFA